ncbi:MAG: type VII toxin-antitoxin system MntA family adenylyltransferase antitoxin [Candidatus Margulisiibacteriota bacterium]
MVVKLQGIKVEVDKKLAGLKSEVASLKGVTAFYLFGSYASGRATTLSDIDLAYLPEENLEADEIQALDKKLYLRLSRLFQTDDLTLINLRDAPLALVYEILQGKLIFCRNHEDLAAFKERILALYPEIRRLQDQFFNTYAKKLKKRYG